jgi:hypothetical protein
MKIAPAARLFSVASLAVLFSTVSPAAAFDESEALRMSTLDPAAFTIGRSELKELPSDEGSFELPEAQPNASLMQDGQDPLDAIEVKLDQVIRIGQKVYKIVESGKPVYNANLHRTDMLPKGITEWQQLTGWGTPMSKRYEWNLKNLYGINVVTVRYRLMYTPGGSLGGRGRYLQAVTIVPEYIYVAWGYSLDVIASTPSITNAGTTESPVAGAEVMIDATVKTVLNTSQMTASYYVRGDGLFKDMQR